MQKTTNIDIWQGWIFRLISRVRRLDTVFSYSPSLVYHKKRVQRCSNVILIPRHCVIYVLCLFWWWHRKISSSKMIQICHWFHPRNIHVFQNFTAEILRSIFKKSTPGFQIIQKMDQYTLQLKLWMRFTIRDKNLSLI